MHIALLCLWFNVIVYCYVQIDDNDTKPDIK